MATKSAPFLRLWVAIGTSALVGLGGAQHWIARDDPLYDYLAHLAPTPTTLSRHLLSREELQRLLPTNEQPLAELARWKLGVSPNVPSSSVVLVQLRQFGYPEGSDWRTATGDYRVVGAWSLTPQALLEVVWSDARRRTDPRFGTVPYATLTLRTGEWRWQAGYGTLRWAGGYSGGLLVNDEMPAVPYLRVQFPLRLPLLGTWQFEQFLSQFEQDGQATWWGARRFERDFGTRWTVALAEAFKALELPTGAVSQLVPYYLYQKWYTEASRGSGWFNYLAEVGILYKLNVQDRVYLFWLIDDMRAPTAFGGVSATPRKVATLIGARLHPAPNTRLIVELVRSDGTRTGGVYDASGHAPRYAYYYKGLPMGHPIGANRIGLYAHAEHQTGRWLYTIDYATLRRFHSYRPGARGYQLEAALGYQMSERGFVTLHYRSSYLCDAGAPDTRAGWFLQLTAQF